MDRNGNVERTLYNMDNQLVYQRAEDKKGRNPVVNQYVYYPDGSLKEAIGGGITYRYEYTKNGLLKSKSAQEKRLLDYFYDRNQNVIRLTDLTGKSTAYTYDTLDRLERVEDMESGEELAAYRYTPSGRKESLRLGNGVQTKYRYGEDGSLSSLVTVTPEGEVVLNSEYAYDGNGNCTKKSGERYQNEYAYDNMGRLLEASYNGRKEAYAYDLAGNRLKKETVEGTELYSYNARNQLLRIEKGGYATYFHYDSQGNMLEEAGGDRKEYAYDALNRQADVTANGLGQINRYDGEGLRYKTENSGNTAFYLFDRGDLTAEMSGDTVGRYARGYDVVYSEYSGEGGGYHIQDEAKSTLFILGRDHEIKKSYRYDAFGRVLEESGEIQNRITYTGQMYDGATEQYYLRARFYNPTIGRFIQEDVYRGDGLNLYAYCANNPVMYYDPSGYMTICPVSVLKDPRNIRYSQDTIGEDFGDMTSVNELLHHLKRDPDYASQIEAIRLVKFKNLPPEVQTYLINQGVSPYTVFSLDNRRLYAAKQARVKVNTTWATQADLDRINLGHRFTTVTGGKTIRID